MGYFGVCLFIFYLFLKYDLIIEVKEALKQKESLLVFLPMEK